MSTARGPTFSSPLATVLATAGVAIGLGNVWRFPYMMGRNGGAAFLLVYLVIVLAFGLPALMAELALGRATGRDRWARSPGPACRGRASLARCWS